MSGISFFTPIEYRGQIASLGQLLIEAVDGYFYLGGNVAVTLPGNVRNGSQEVVIQQRETAWWKTALKVLSYATVIIPIIMLIAKAILRSYFRFHTCRVNEPVNHNEYPYMVAKAPLTLVRSMAPTDLKISVLYNQRFRPQGPIVPEPTEIETDGGISKYTWSVRTQNDGTLGVNQERVNMIWWEAMRQGAITGVDATQAVCVKRDELEGFLKRALKKRGVHDNELEAFTHYWRGLLEGGNTPYVLVQLIKPSEVQNYVPEMQVEGEKAALFALKRFYFRFEPVSDASRGIESERYLSALSEAELGPNAVIDLGGEVIGDGTREWEPAFNEQFIGKYIYA